MKIIRKCEMKANNNKILIEEINKLILNFFHIDTIVSCQIQRHKLFLNIFSFSIKEN